MSTVPLPDPDCFPDGPPSGHSHSYSGPLVRAYGDTCAAEERAHVMRAVNWVLGEYTGYGLSFRRVLAELDRKRTERET